MIEQHYDQAFFENLDAGSARSAQIIVPMVQEIVKASSVLDLGCGSGAWLHAWKQIGVTDFNGVDGHYVDPLTLSIPENSFVAHDLGTPLELGREFDLAMSVEVAEHIGAEHSRTYVASLVKHSDLVLFSAAIPGQGGTRHINEQWLSFWTALFSEHGYRLYDVLRSRIWTNQNIEVWYRQNCVLFAAESAAERCGLVETAGPIDIVHPELFTSYTGESVRSAVMRSAKQSLVDSPVGPRLRKVYGRLRAR